MFARIAPRYDFLNHLLSLNVDRYWRRKSVTLAAAQPDAQILDVCCGTGDLAIEFAHRLGPNGRVTGTDFVAPMLELFRAKVAGTALEHKLNISQADTLALPFADESFNLTSVAFGIRNVADLERGLREMRRVLYPGGKAVILEFNDTHHPVFGPLFKLYFSKILPRLGALISRDSRAYTYLPDSVGKFPPRPAFLKLMEQSGFSNCHVHSMTFGVVSCFIGTKP